jgi:predicted MFS family arabinose efflux permease
MKDLDYASDLKKARFTREWLSVLSLSFGTFALVTSELMPIGLLPKISASLGIASGAAGMTITIPGLVAAFAAPALIAFSKHLDRRLLLWITSVMLIVSDLLVASAGNTATLLAGRSLLGVSIGGFWAVGAATATRLVDPGLAGRATAVVFVGISAGTVIGLPAGTLLGEWLGWRLAFVGAAGVGGLSLVMQVLLLPRLAPTRVAGLAQFPAFLRVRQARIGLAAAALVITGHFMAYTFVSSFLLQYARVPSGTVSVVLMAYGVAGLIGNSIAGELLQRDVRRTLLGIGLLLAACILLIAESGFAPPVKIALVVIWGLAFGGVPVTLQSWIFKAVPDLGEGGSALFVSTFQLAIAAGSLLGGAILDVAGLRRSMTWGAVAVFAMVAVVAIAGKSIKSRQT